MKRFKEFMAEGKIMRGDTVRVDSKGDKYHGKAGVVTRVGSGKTKGTQTVKFVGGQTGSYNDDELVVTMDESGIHESFEKKVASNLGDVEYMSKNKDGNFFVVTKRSVGGAGTQDKVNMYVVDKTAKVVKDLGSHISTKGALKFAKSRKLVEEIITEELKLTKGNKKVIDAFINKKKADDQKFESTGTVLDGLWMGGKEIAYWKNNKINFGNLTSRSQQTVQKYIRKAAPSMDLNEAVTKSKSASKVLKLMDQDVEYQAAVKKVAKEDKITTKQLEKELEPFI